MIYYYKYCIDENHKNGPYIKFAIWDSNKILRELSLTKLGENSSLHFKDYIGKRVPENWEINTVCYKIIKFKNRGDLMLELL